MSGTGDRVRIGVIGCGGTASSFHLPVLEHLPEAEVVAVADIDTERLREVGDRFRVRHRHARWEDLLGNPEVDAVAVFVPTAGHGEIARAAIDAGRHLLVEKPLALTLREIDELEQRAAGSPGTVMVGMNLRWHRAVRSLRDLIRAGAVGVPEAVRTIIASGFLHQRNVPAWRRRREQGGGVLFEVAVHHFDLLRFLLDSEVEEVFAAARTGEGDDETAVITTRMSNGVLAGSLFSERTVQRHELEIFGRSGCLSASLYRFDCLQHHELTDFQGSVRTRVKDMVNTLKELPGGMARMRRGGDFLESFRAEWRHFLDAVLRGTPVECTLEEGKKAVRIALAAVASASGNRSVSVSAVTDTGSGGYPDD